MMEVNLFFKAHSWIILDISINNRLKDKITYHVRTNLIVYNINFKLKKLMKQLQIDTGRALQISYKKKLGLCTYV